MADITQDTKAGDESLTQGKVRRNLVLIAIATLVTVAVIGVILQLGGASTEEEVAKAKKDGERQKTAAELQMPSPDEKDVRRDLGLPDEEEESHKPVDEPSNRDGRGGVFPKDSPLANGDGIQTEEESRRLNEEHNKASIAASPLIALEGDSGASSQQTSLDGTVSDPMAGLREVLLQSVQSGQQQPDYSQLLNASQQGAGKSPQRQKEEWLRSASEGASSGDMHVEPPKSPYTVYQGTIIPAVLITSIRSDLPGYITAQVTQDVYDTINGRHLVIPKGSKLVGNYDSEISSGQERVLAAFHRIILPNGASIQLGGMQAANASGQSGMQDHVDHHFWKRFGPPVLVASLANLLTRKSDNVTVVSTPGSTASVTDAAGQILVDTAKQVLERRQEIQSTLIIRQGYKFNILVNRDLVLAPGTKVFEGREL